MTKKLVYILAVLFLTSSLSAKEHYLYFIIDSESNLSEITKTVSIDNIKGDTLFAYVNDKQLENLRKFQIEYTELIAPSKLIKPTMAQTQSSMAEWNVYPTYEIYDSLMNQFALDYPTICQLTSIGQSVQGRELYFVRISDNVTIEENEPEVMYSSSMHGDEISGYVTMLRFIDYLLSNYGSDAQVTNMVDNMEIWINPSANPDGTYASGNNTVFGATRGNANGYDLNRNFPDPEDGPHPDGNSWQAETVAMMNFFAQHRFIISANFHGGAEVANYSWDTWGNRHPDDLWFIDICRKYADTAQAYSPSGYFNDLDDGITNGYDWYPIFGGRQDYVIYFHGGREITIELSAIKLVSESSLPLYWNYNRVALLNYLENALYGIKGIVTDSTSGLPLDATIIVLGHDQDSSYVFTDPDVGDYHRMIEAGTFDLKFISPGYKDKIISGVIVASGGVTIQDAELSPIPDTSVLEFLSENTTTIYPGDEITFDINLSNIGGAEAINVMSVLTTNNSNINLTQINSSYGNIGAFGNISLSSTSYQFSVDSSFPHSGYASFELEITADGGYADILEFDISIGFEVERFENANFYSYPWQNNGHALWGIDSTTAKLGRYSAVSGEIQNSETSTLKIQLSNLIAGEISFSLKTSTEKNEDYLTFYLDFLPQANWSGETEWTTVTFPIDSGDHLFTWTYAKGFSHNSGEDAVWIDNIVFPVLDTDSDDDFVSDYTDNCLNLYNPEQADPDGDNIGSLCDNCPNIYNPLQIDSDSDSIGDLCENSCCDGNAGNIDYEGDMNIADLTYMVNYMFKGGLEPPCRGEADFNADSEINIQDLTKLVNYMFRDGEPPSSCL